MTASTRGPYLPHQQTVVPTPRAEGPTGDTSRTVLITGATGGIGKATALGLAPLGAHVAITGHDQERTEDGGDEIRAAGGGQVDVFLADLSSQSEVRRLAGEVLERLPRIDVLVNNVGRLLEHPAPHRGRPRAHLRRQPSRTVPAHQPAARPAEGQRPGPRGDRRLERPQLGRIDFDDLQGERSYSGARAYNQSKLANVLFSYELARRLAGTGVTANALHPGVVRTGFGAEDPAGAQRLFVPLLRPFMKSPARGAATSIHLASAPSLGR